MRHIRLNGIIIATKNIESVEWRDVTEEMSDTDYLGKLYSIVFHMKSGKKFTRRVYEKQLEQCKDALRDYLGYEDEME
tara:strand:- start:2552 stop:2785 length:234 start_codon:yes stop_codon:yes gene_type:complete